MKDKILTSASLTLNVTILKFMSLERPAWNLENVSGEEEAT